MAMASSRKILFSEQHLTLADLVGLDRDLNPGNTLHGIQRNWFLD